MLYKITGPQQIQVLPFGTLRNFFSSVVIFDLWLVESVAVELMDMDANCTRSFKKTVTLLNTISPYSPLPN